MQGNHHDAIVLSRSRFRRVLAGSTAVISLAGLTVEVLKSIYRWKGRSGIVPLFSLSNEQNVPTYFTAVLLLVAAAMSALLAAAARHTGSAQPGSRRDALAFWGLCAGFAYISVDEVIEIHEHWGGPFQGSGVLHFGWIVPALGILAVLAVLYFRFLLRLPPRLRNRLLLAGCLYVLGAVVMELPLGWWTEKKGEKTLGYALIDWVEETLEMVGIGLFLCTAFDMLAEKGASLRFGAREAADGGAPPARTSAPPLEPAKDSP